ncbi:uncharacterized protein LOC134256409 [Saccostrea cucullata]|uniref:uncharacterized protein LOC134256409 n=1 Tax=Saccostrea cuccullata TaxID=36930 RepID=UPI002ED0C036
MLSQELPHLPEPISYLTLRHPLLPIGIFQDHFDIDEYRPYLGGGSSVYRERYYDSGPRFGSGAADDYFLGGGPIIGESGFGSLSGSSSFDYLRGSGDSGLDYLRGSGGSGLDYIDSGDYIPGAAPHQFIGDPQDFPPLTTSGDRTAFPRPITDPGLPRSDERTPPPDMVLDSQLTGTGVCGGRQISTILLDGPV